MKICFLAPASNYHTKKWCNWFLSKGHEVHVLSLIESEIPGVSVHYLFNSAKPGDSDIKKLSYLFAVSKIKKLLKEISPDIINAHYASSYGLLASLACPNQYFLSVWGSDVYDFPQKSIFHRFIIKHVLKKAKHILSTSKAMACETKKYTNRDIFITPFGVDMNLFHPRDKKIYSKEIKIGTIKALSDIYGIQYLLSAFSLVVKSENNYSFMLLIGGKGPQENEYKRLAKELHIDDKVRWLGFLSQERVADELASFDMAIVYSDRESFGVSAVEANASGVPLIISDIPGLMETTKPGITSVVVERSNPKKLASAIISLANDPELQKRMALAGREYAYNNFELNKCFQNIEKIFLNNK